MNTLENYGFQEYLKRFEEGERKRVKSAPPIHLDLSAGIKIRSSVMPEPTKDFNDWAQKIFTPRDWHVRMLAMWREAKNNTTIKNRQA